MSASSCGHVATPGCVASVRPGYCHECPRRPTDRTPPGRSTGPWPCQSIDQRVERGGVRGGQRRRAARGAQAAQHPGADRPRQVGERSRRPDVELASPAGRGHVAIGPARRGRRGRRAAARRCGPAPRRPRPAARPRAAAAPRCAAAPAGSAGSSLCGSATASRPERGAGGRGGRAAQAEQRAQPAAVARRHPGDRARPGAAAEPEQHRLGLVVEGVAEQDAGVERGRGRVQGGVAGGPGRRLRAARAADRHRRRSRPGRTPARSRSRRPARACSAEPSTAARGRR